VHDRVAEVLAQRATLDRGAAAGVAWSLVLHGGLIALALYAATHAETPVPAKTVSIQFAQLRGAQRPAPAIQKPAPEPVTPKIEEPKPKIAAPQPAVETPPPAKPEKNTVPLSPFGRSTKKGSDAAPPAKTIPAPPAAAPPGVATTTDVPIGGTGVQGLEGGDFPYTIYIEAMQRKIGSNWFRPQIAGGAATIVYFRILRDGSIGETRVETSSGNATFDRAALSAVRSSQPLNPLPFGYSGSYLGVHLTFR
jgi:periplasmic protein TonB